MEVTEAEALTWLPEPTWMPGMEGLYLDHWLASWVWWLVLSVCWLLPAADLETHEQELLKLMLTGFYQEESVVQLKSAWVLCLGYSLQVWDKHSAGFSISLLRLSEAACAPDDH